MRSPDLETKYPTLIALSTRQAATHRRELPRDGTRRDGLTCRQQQARKTMGRTTRVLAEGIYFGEAPRWHDDRLWFSDFYAHAVKSVSLTGDARNEFGIDDRPSGLGWMPDGTMLVVSMTKRQVLRRSRDGQIAVHADLGAIAGFHCNDMVVDFLGPRLCRQFRLRPRCRAGCTRGRKCDRGAYQGQACLRLI